MSDPHVITTSQEADALIAHADTSDSLKCGPLPKRITASTHRGAAVALAERMGWSGLWVGAPLGKGFVFVQVGADPLAFLVAKKP